MIKRAKFITFEGTEGSGKTTQIRRLCEAFEKRGIDVLVTREPGGTQLGNELRRLLLQTRDEELDPKAELLLIEAARAQHYSQVLEPALSKNDLILCDRYADASTAYQGAGRGMDAKWIEDLNGRTTENLVPDRTFLLDLSEEVSVKRALGRMAKSKEIAEDRFENEALSFHRRVREAYLDLSRKHPSRFFVVNGADSLENVFRVIEKEIEKVLGL